MALRLARRPVDDGSMRVWDLSGGTEILDESECWALVGTAGFGRIAVVTRGRPDIFPVNYQVQDRLIEFRTNMGLKLLGTSGSAVAFEVDRVDETAETGWSVVIHGVAHDVSEEHGPGSDRSWTGPKDFVIRIDPLSVSGRRVPSRFERGTRH